MAQTVTSADKDAVRKALLAIRLLQRPDNTLEQSLNAIRELNDPDLKDCLMNAYINLCRLERPPEEDEDEDEEDIPRQLRWQRRDTTFTNLMNITCYRAARDIEAQKARGEPGRILVLPYGLAPSDSVWMKIRNYQTAISGRGGFSGGQTRYATKTIKLLCEFAPTDEELDEAAEYYRRTE